MAQEYTGSGLSAPTPKIIKYFMVSSLVFGCLSGFFKSVLGEYLNLSFIHVFGLSFQGLKRGFIWQPFTFMFLPETPGSLSFYFLFTLCFDIYLLWFIGCKVYRYLGQKGTLRLFFIPTLFSSIITAILSHFLSVSPPPLFGISYSMIPLIMGYCFSNPHATFSFFLTQSIRVKWLGLGLVLLYLFQDLSNLNFIALLAHVALFVSAYFYMMIFEKKGSPFSLTERMDALFLRRKKTQNDSKIIHLYEIYDTREHFINRTLGKIGQGQKISLMDRLRLKMYSMRKKNRL
jgi:hypothetical protein